MSGRKPYPSDLSDARWALIEPTLTAWRNARLERRPTGQPAKVDLRDVFNAILYINRTGIPWKYLPHDFPGHGTVYFYYAAWRDEGILAQLNYDLTGLARAKEGRKPRPLVREPHHQRGGVDADDLAVRLAVTVEHRLADCEPAAAGHQCPSSAQRFISTCMSVTTVPRSGPVALSRRRAWSWHPAQSGGEPFRVR